MLLMNFGVVFAEQNDPHFVGIGDLPGGWYLSDVQGISANGKYVCGLSDQGPGSQPIKWDRTDGILRLRPSGVFIGGGANSVSINGQVVVGGGTRNDNKFEAFIWTPELGLVGMGYLPGGRNYSIAECVSWDGKTVSGYSNSPRATTSEGFRWSAIRGYEVIGDLPGGAFVSIVTDMSADGSVIVGYSVSSNGTEAFRWTEDDGIIGLGDLPGGGFDSRALAVSGDGKVIFGTSAVEGLIPSVFRWTHEGGMVAVPNPAGAGPNDGAQATAANFDGSIAVGNINSSIPVIWEDQHEPRLFTEFLEERYHLDLSEWEWVGPARAISADGRTIAGYGRSVRGHEGWVAYLGPPPCLGDLNHDNAVNMVDLVTLLIHFGDTLAGPTEGDLDRDADVDLSDLTVLLAGYGRVCD